MDDKNKIRYLVQNNHMSEAKTLCIDICTNNPDDPEAWFLHGMLNGILNDFSGAEDCYSNVIRLMPDMAAAYYNKAVALLSLEKHEEAVTALEKVIELEPDFENINLTLAEAFSALGDSEAALGQYQSALNKHPDNVQIKFKLGELLLKGGSYQNAEIYLRKVVSINPTHEKAIFNLASSLQLQGQYEESEIFYKKAIEVRPDYCLAYNNIGILYKERELIEVAARYFNEAVKCNPDYADAYVNLGHAYQILEKYYDALLAFQKANDLKPNDPEIYYSLGLQYEKLGNLSDSILCFSKASMLNKDSLRYLFVLARVFVLKKKFDKAIFHYKNIISKDASFIDAYCELGKVYIEIDNKDLATGCFQKVLAIQPDHLTANYYISYLNPTYAKQDSDKQYIERLFDGYAETFENDLVTNLEYQTPGVIHGEVVKYIDMLNDLTIFDLGCGTGLCGELFRTYACHLVGVDISSKIVEKASEKGIYDELYVEDLSDRLHKEKSSIDLILAADVFVYTGDLESIFRAAKKALKPNGLLTFSVEHSSSRSFEINGNGRYSHSAYYIEDLAVSSGYQILNHVESVLRKEYGSDVQGDVYVLRSLII